MNLPIGAGILVVMVAVSGCAGNGPYGYGGSSYVADYPYHGRGYYPNYGRPYPYYPYGVRRFQEHPSQASQPAPRPPPPPPQARPPTPQEGQRQLDQLGIRY